MLLGGCATHTNNPAFGVYANTVAPAAATTLDFSALTCEELAGQKARIEAGYEQFNGTIRAHARKNLRVLNADMLEVNEQIFAKRCDVSPVRQLLAPAANRGRMEYRGGSQAD